VSVYPALVNVQRKKKSLTVSSRVMITPQVKLLSKLDIVYIADCGSASICNVLTFILFNICEVISICLIKKILQLKVK
jgi:hypothetical protein